MYLQTDIFTLHFTLKVHRIVSLAIRKEEDRIVVGLLSNLYTLVAITIIIAVQNTIRG